MSFAWPLVLMALFAIPLVVFAYWLVQRRRQKFAVRFTNLDLLANVVDKSPAWRRHVPPALYLLAIAALILALARPNTSIAVPKEEATVVLVTDISGSMNATDVKPTRLGAARDAAIAFVNALPERFQIALISFSTGVQTLVTPTDSKEDVRQAIQRLRANGGTSMGDAIMQALDLVRPVEVPDAPSNGNGATPTPTAVAGTAQNQRPAVIVLLSDGANTTGAALPIDAANEALARGVQIFTVALGTQDGVVDIPDQFGRLRRVAVPPDPDTLQQIAEITHGRFFDAPSADELKSVYDDLGSQIGYETKDREITAAFAGAGLAFLVLGGAAATFWFNRFP